MIRLQKHNRRAALIRIRVKRRRYTEAYMVALGMSLRGLWQ